jgi:hypothetical protein
MSIKPDLKCQLFAAFAMRARLQLGDLWLISVDLLKALMGRWTNKTALTA